jgi:hypothetical protein
MDSITRNLIFRRENEKNFTKRSPLCSGLESFIRRPGVYVASTSPGLLVAEIERLRFH